MSLRVNVSRATESSSSGAFRAQALPSTKQRQKYAQCYALFLFCLEGIEGAYRAPLFEYLRTALKGQGQASTFRRIFRKDLDLIEEAYLLMR